MTNQPNDAELKYTKHGNVILLRFKNSNYLRMVIHPVVTKMKALLSANPDIGPT